MIKTRIAPSPTGYMHIGNARTALFNYLFAKKYHGEFLLRIENTDLERSKKEYELDILGNLKWLGLNWDGEIIYQRERSPVHREYLEKLLGEGKAFYCRHSAEELAGEQKEQQTNKTVLKHNCDHKDKSLAGGVIRLKNQNKKIVFNDIIRGEVTFDSELLGDIVLAKNLNTPLYNFAAAADDHDTEISHVIRGEDHLSNTPKQILIQEALGFKRPDYAHVPLILAKDRSKLSKRHGSPRLGVAGGTAVTEYKNAGYLPQALVNFMALLGWHPADNREIFGLEDLIKEFDLARVQKAGAVFDGTKLDSINNYHIKQLVPAELAQYLKPYLNDHSPSDEQIIKIAHLFQDRLNKFSEIAQLSAFIFNQPEYDSKMLLWKGASPEKTKNNLETILMILEKLSGDSFDIDSTATEIMPLANKTGRGEMLWPLRVALTGLEKSPGPFEIMEVLGREESINRIKKAAGKL
ncbi:MAG: glutamate--tRNA ligase [Parcubacteria group bacterium]|nr:glutamate--tRNA ligase [Parcubacteria group bacterium]